MDTKKKVIIGTLIGAGVTALSALMAYKFFKERKICLCHGDDDDVVYVLLDGDEENQKNYKISGRKNSNEI